MPGLGDILQAALAPYVETAVAQALREGTRQGRATPISGARSGTRTIKDPSKVDRTIMDWRGTPRGPANLPPGWVDPDSRFPNTPLDRPPTDPGLPPGSKGTPSPAPPGGTPRVAPHGTTPPLDVNDINDRIARLIRDQVIPRSIRDTQGDQGYNKGFQRTSPTGEDLGFSTLQDLLAGGGAGMENLISSYLGSFTNPYATGQPDAYKKGFATGVEPGLNLADPGTPGTPAGGAPSGFTPSDKGAPGGAAPVDPNQATGGAAGLPTASYYDPIFGNVPGALSPADVGVPPTSMPYQDPLSRWGITGGAGGYQMGQLGPASTEASMGNPLGGGAGGTTLSSADMGQGMYGQLFDFLQNYLHPEAAPTSTPTTPTTPAPPTTPGDDQWQPTDDMTQLMDTLAGTEGDSVSWGGRQFVRGPDGGWYDQTSGRWVTDGQGAPYRDYFTTNWQGPSAEQPPEQSPPEEQPPPENDPYAQYSQYYQGGNIGNSAMSDRYADPAWHPPGQPESSSASGQTYEQWRQEMAQRYPWMNDTNIVWGGGPEGYLPINYQAQDLDYYRQATAGGNVNTSPWVQKDIGGGRMRWVPSGPTSQMAPWELAYMKDTWTQNYDPNAPGYFNTRSPGATQPTPGSGTQPPPPPTQQPTANPYAWMTPQQQAFYTQLHGQTGNQFTYQGQDFRRNDAGAWVNWTDPANRQRITDVQGNPLQAKWPTTFK